MIFTDNTYIYIPMGVFAASAEKQAFTREAAYIDIILMADESEGMITTSVELLSKRWSWSYIRTYSLLGVLRIRASVTSLSTMEM